MTEEKVTYYISPSDGRSSKVATHKPEDLKIGINVLGPNGIPYEFGLSPQEAAEFSEADLKRAGSYISKYYDEIFSPDAMSREDREKSIAGLKAQDPVLYTVLSRLIGRHKWSNQDGKTLIDLNTGYQPGRALIDRPEAFSDKKKELRTSAQLEKAKERSLKADIDAINKQSASMLKDVDTSKALESLNKAKDRGQIANVGQKSAGMGGGLTGRSQGQLNQLRKMFVKNIFDTEKYPDRQDILDRYSIGADSKDALLTFLKGPKGDSSVYGDFIDKYPVSTDRVNAILEAFKNQGKTDDVQSAILAGLRRM